MSEATQAAVSAAVRNLLATHAQAQDAGRTDDVVALYAKDGVLEVPGLDPIEGHDALRTAFQGWAPTQPQVHLVSNTVLTSWTAEDATAVSDVAFARRGESGWAVQMIARYQDSLRLVDGSWLLRHRSTTLQA